MTTPRYVTTAAAVDSSGIVTGLALVILAVSVAVALVLQRTGRLPTGATRERRLRESEIESLEGELQEQRRAAGLPPEPAITSPSRSGSSTGSTPGPNGFGLKALLALLVFASCAAVSVWQYVDAHLAPREADVQHATVTGTDRGPSGSARSGGGGIVSFSLPDGRTGSVYLDARLGTPDRGDEIDVYRRDGEWRSPDERSTSGLLFGVAGVLGFALLVLAWWRGRRAASREHDRLAVPLPPTHQG